MNNYVSLIGNLGNDPELIKSGGKDFLVISLAQNYLINEVSKTDWLEVSVFGEAKDRFSKLKKGDFVHIEGSIRQFKKKIGEINIKQTKINGYKVKLITKGDKIKVTDFPNFEEKKEVPF